VWLELGAALRAADEDISATVAERDPASSGDLDAYLAISRSALQAMAPALAAAGVGGPESILDLPCGYGRVTRALRAAWPAAEIVAADQSSAAVAFTVEQFDAVGWEVEDYLSLDGQSRAGSFDLIWSSSLLSMVEPKRLDDCLVSLLAMLRPGGVLVAAYHGRDSTRRFSEQSDEGLRSLAQSVAETGVGFRPRSSAGLGTTAFLPQWLMPHLARHRNLMVLAITERGWADHLDVLAVTLQDVHHPQKALGGTRRAPAS
jgi:trans-aconitate methyltransferase